MGNNSEAGRCLNDTLCRKIGGFNDFIVIELTLSDRLRVDAEAADIDPWLATAFRMRAIGHDNKAFNLVQIIKNLGEMKTTPNRPCNTCGLFDQ